MSMHDSPASMHDSPASMLKAICFTPRGSAGAGAGAAGRGASPAAAAAAGHKGGSMSGVIMSPCDAPPPSKDTIAERKRALMESAKAALARAGRKPLLSEASKAEVTFTAGPAIVVNENPWVQ